MNTDLTISPERMSLITIRLLLFLVGCLGGGFLLAQKKTDSVSDYATLQHNQTVASASVLQFMGSRCGLRQELPYDVSSDLQLLQLLPPAAGIALETPFTVYLQRAADEVMYDIGSGLLEEGVTINLPGGVAEQTYYVVFFDLFSPALLRIDPVASHVLLMSGCALHLPLPYSPHY